MPMIHAFTMALRQIGNKALRRVFWLAVLASVAVFVCLWLAVGFVLIQTEIFSFDGFLGLFNKIFEWITDIFGVTVVVITSWLLFPSVVSLIVSFFL